MNKIMLYTIVFSVGFISVSLWSFWIVTHPPKLTLVRTPNDFNLPKEDIILTTDDNLKLSAWFMEPPSPSTKALILLHGYPAEKADMLNIAKSLYPDFTLLLLDLRYFGKSEGAYTTLGTKEPKDIQKALDFLETRGYQKIGVFGFSLGGAVGLLTAANDDRIDAVGSYASFSSIRTLGWDTYRNLFILKYPLVELMNLWSKLFFGTFIATVSPEKAVRNITVPVFIIHTQEDDQISFSHAKRIEKALEHNKNAEFYFPEHGLHGELPVDFNTRLKDFFIHSL